jgi:hypothetical protein
MVWAEDVQDPARGARCGRDAEAEAEVELEPAAEKGTKRHASGGLRGWARADDMVGWV